MHFKEVRFNTAVFDLRVERSSAFRSRGLEWFAVGWRAHRTREELKTQTMQVVLGGPV